MKALVLILALIPTVVFADFRPGRVRTAAVAEMEIINATGIYANVKKARIGALYGDGVGLVGYTLELDGKQIPLTRGSELKETSCGKEMEMAVSIMGTGQIVSNLIVNDTTNAACRRRFDGVWEAALRTVNIRTRETSELRLGGTPEYLMMTMSAGPGLAQ